MLKFYAWANVNVMYYATQLSDRTYLASYGLRLVKELRARNVTVTEIPVEYSEDRCVTDSDVDTALDTLELSNSRILFNFLGGPDSCAIDSFMTRYEARGLTGQYQMLLSEIELDDAERTGHVGLNRSIVLETAWNWANQESTSKLNTFLNKRLAPNYGDWHHSFFNQTFEWSRSNFGGSGTGSCADFAPSWMPVSCARPRPSNLGPPTPPTKRTHPHGTPANVGSLFTPCPQAATTRTMQSLTSLARSTQPSAAAIASPTAPRS